MRLGTYAKNKLLTSFYITVWMFQGLFDIRLLGNSIYTIGIDRLNKSKLTIDIKVINMVITGFYQRLCELILSAAILAANRLQII